MHFRITFRRAAKAELLEAGAWYESKRSGLAAGFMAEIKRCLSLVAANPLQFALHRRDIRCIVTKRFPYSIYFRAEPGRVVVLAVFHNKRDLAPLLERD